MGLNVADVTCALSIILHSLKVCFIITQAVCHSLTSGPVYSCYSSPCRWRKWGSPFHSQVCSWSVGWQCLLTGPCWSLIWSAICSVIYNVGECSPAAGTDQPQDCLCRAQENLRHRHLSSSSFYFVHSGWNFCGNRKYTDALPDGKQIKVRVANPMEIATGICQIMGLSPLWGIGETTGRNRHKPSFPQREHWYHTEQFIINQVPPEW